MHLLFDTASAYTASPYTVHLSPVAVRCRTTVPQTVFRRMTAELCALGRRLCETNDPAAQYLVRVDGYAGVIQVNPLRRTATLLSISAESADNTGAHR